MSVSPSPYSPYPRFVLENVAVAVTFIVEPFSDVHVQLFHSLNT